MSVDKMGAVTEHRLADADLARRLDEFTDVMRRLAAGDFDARAARDDLGTPTDVLAFLINAVAEELGAVFARAERKSHYLATVLEAVADPLAVVTPTGVIERVNAAMAAALNRDVEELLGELWTTLLPLGATTDWFDDAQRGRTVRNRDVRFKAAQGSIELVTTAAPIRDGAALLGVVIVARDLRLQRELARLVDARLE